MFCRCLRYMNRLVSMSLVVHCMSRSHQRNVRVSPLANVKRAAAEEKSHNRSSLCSAEGQEINCISCSIVIFRLEFFLFRKNGRATE